MLINPPFGVGSFVKLSFASPRSIDGDWAASTVSAPGAACGSPVVEFNVGASDPPWKLPYKLCSWKSLALTNSGLWDKLFWSANVAPCQSDKVERATSCHSPTLPV